MAWLFTVETVFGRCPFLLLGAVRGFVLTGPAGEAEGRLASVYVLVVVAGQTSFLGRDL